MLAYSLILGRKAWKSSDAPEDISLQNYLKYLMQSIPNPINHINPIQKFPLSTNPV